MKAKQLPSGSWRCRVYVGKDENGKMYYKSFIDPDRKHCEALAAKFADMHRHAYKNPTLALAITEYLTIREDTLSPKTFKEYNNYYKILTTDYVGLCSLPVQSINSKHIQQFVNQMHRNGRTPKTIHNYCGFISAVLDLQDVKMPKYVLPKVIKEEPYIPSSEEVQLIIETAREKKPELVIPIMLAAFGSMRRSEICALKYPDDFKGNTVTINKDMVQNEKLKWIVHTTKTAKSTRKITLPDFLIEEIKRQGYITQMNPNQITNEFIRLVRELGLPHFSIHKLRHYSASVALGMGIPLTIVADRGGWEPGSGILQKIYTHVLEEQRNVETEKINSFFADKFAKTP